MRKALTTISISALKPQEKPYYIGDSKQDGLRLRVAPDGSMTWNVSVRIKHSKTLSASLGRCDPDGKSGLDLAEARRRAAEIVKAARQGINLIAAERGAREEREKLIKISTLIDIYSEDLVNPSRKGGPLKTALEIRRRLKRALTTKLSVAACEIQRRDIAAILDPVFNEFPREAEKRRQVIDAMFRWGIAKGYVENSPVQGLPSYGSGVLRDRVLTRDEIKIFWKWLERGAAGMPEDAILVLKLQLLTGARVGEISGMTAAELWRERDQLYWTLPAGRSKNKKIHTRPMVGMAEMIITGRLQSGASGALFRTVDRVRALRSDDIGLALNHRDRPIAHFTTHDLRRTVVSGLDELGIPLDSIAAVVGHQRGGAQTRTLVKHYSRPKLDERIQAALIVWDQFIMTLIESDA